jgi:hypothetical protein
MGTNMFTRTWVLRLHATAKQRYAITSTHNQWQFEFTASHKSTCSDNEGGKINKCSMTPSPLLDQCTNNSHNRETTNKLWEEVAKELGGFT